jgi:hypothetical protein
MLQVKSPQDLGAGIVFILIGAAGLIFGRELSMGTPGRMGPGYFPTLLSYIIIAIGVFVAARSFTLEGPPLERFYFRPLAFVVGAIILSGYLLNWFGLVLTSIAVAVISSYARRDVKLLEVLLLGVGMGLFSVVVFVYALGQPLPAWWGR